MCQKKGSLYTYYQPPEYERYYMKTFSPSICEKALLDNKY